MKATYPVQGMSCAACASSVASMLNNTAGVKTASVNYANQTAWVEFDPAITTALELQKAVQSIGYDLVLSTEQASVQDTVDHLQAARLQQVRSQAIGSMVCSIPVAVVGMAMMEWKWANYFMMVLTLPVVAVWGRHFFVSAWKKALHGQANMDTLVAVSTGIAFGFSLFNTFFPELWHRHGLHAHVYYEAAAVVIAFVSLGKWLEERAKSSTSSAIRNLIGLQPKTVGRVGVDGKVEIVAIGQVQVGDLLLAKPGDQIAVDGRVAKGDSFVDESSVSGEPIPASKSKGDRVFAGTINQQGTFWYTAEQVGEATVLAQIIRSVQEAQGSKAPLQRTVDKVAGWFVPFVFLVAVITFVLWIALAQENALAHAIMASVTVLVIACPCALGLATPTAVMVGIGKGAEQHVLIKDAESLERASEVEVVVVDKTGTLTEGKPTVLEVVWKEGEGTEAKQYLAGFAALSNHPLSQAIAKYYATENPTSLVVAKSENVPGKGMVITMKNHTYLLGNRALLANHGAVVPPSLDQKAHAWTTMASSLVFFARDGEVVAVAAIGDQVKSSAAAAIQALKDLRMEVYLVTGDHPQAAEAVARQVGIAHFHGAALPADKAAFVQTLQAQGKKVAMVGDGINDSQALAQADVSMAMGKGADIALDVAKMTLLRSDPMSIHTALRLSRQTVRTIRQNLFWAFVYNVVGIPVAAGILYPWNGFLLNPMMAGAAMALSSISVVVNSLLLRTK